MKVHLMPLLEKIAFEKREKLLKSHFDFPIFLPLNERIKISFVWCYVDFELRLPENSILTQ